MRKKMLLLLVLAALAGSIRPAYAEDEDRSKEKDECMLVAIECGTSAQSIQDKIERLQEAIAKGTAVYTPEELNQLKRRLEEVSKVLDMLGNKPPYVDDRRR